MLRKINSVADNIRYTSERLTATSSELKENLPQILDYLEFLKRNQQDMSAQIKNISNLNPAQQEAQKK